MAIKPADSDRREWRTLHILKNAFQETCKISFSKKEFPTMGEQGTKRPQKESKTLWLWDQGMGDIQGSSKAFKKSVNATKTKYWKNNCESPGDIKDPAKLSKILEKP
ncbi:hypothetical protein KR032_006874 [Drosophila birchii]|nr:hypothetical protein KR032_006874 [Drosophila birchii]